MFRITVALAASVVLMAEGQGPLLIDAPGPGVPLELAEDRAGRVSNLRYQLHFTVPEGATDGLQGEVTLRFDLKDARKPLYLDFKGEQEAVLGGRINGREKKPALVVEHLALAAADLKEGANEITVRFRSSGAGLNQNPEFMFALFVPARAREGGIL